MALNLWTSYYDCKDETHQKEILRAIELNCENPKIDKIYLLCELDYPIKHSKVKCVKVESQPTYKTFIDYFQTFFDDDYNIIINSDIVLDYDTTDLFKTIPEGTVYALSRYEVDDNTYYEPIESWKTSLFYYPHYSQDTWGFYKTSLDTSKFNIFMGAAGCDNIITYLLDSQSISLINPCLSIKTYHIHSSTVRNYKIKYDYKNVNGGLLVTASSLDDYKSTIYSKYENGIKRDYNYNQDDIKDTLDTIYTPPKYDDLAVGLVFFNSIKSKRMVMNYLYTIEKFKLAKIPYYTMELVYDGRSPEIADAFHVRGASYMFHKENLCHLLEKRIPANYTKLLFLDADIVFSDEDWYNKLSEKLNSYEVVQPFTNAIWLNLEYNDIIRQRITCVFDKDKSKININGAHVGFAWAFQRSYFNEVGMFQYAIVGSGDTYSSMLYLNNKSFLNNPGSIQGVSSQFNMLFNSSKRPSISYLNGNIFHLWHGSIENRNYAKRADILSGIEDISNILIKNQDGVIEFTDPTLNEKMYDYFFNRDDDGLSEVVKKNGTSYINNLNNTGIHRDKNTTKLISTRVFN
jgi:hypothetical protein